LRPALVASRPTSRSDSGNAQSGDGQPEVLLALKGRGGQTEKNNGVAVLPPWDPFVFSSTINSTPRILLANNILSISHGGPKATGYVLYRVPALLLGR